MMHFLEKSFYVLQIVAMGERRGRADKSVGSTSWDLTTTAARVNFSNHYCCIYKRNETPFTTRSWKREKFRLIMLMVTPVTTLTN